MRLLDTSRRIHDGPKACIVGLTSYFYDTSKPFMEVTPEDSVHLYDEIERGDQVKEFGKRFEAVVARSEMTTKDVQDHLTDLGLREATVYVDDDGVQCSRDVAKKMTPGWMVEWLYGESPES
ncbi:uncharacterized protein CLUP02_09356 [Colletotrichum lupini]|uniref:Uncharacterized protein n=1 Tax=Colletotrichum lupini TaxID=145971 RepID=A0A9Q8SVI0_9PEZI|nr:uncharacterized protein CLUP02_09356 [Colletotrichum lupini]UQC83860.1 hypothetical protein CLUP02_09356 [Colletotrichum lupini]